MSDGIRVDAILFESPRPEALAAFYQRAFDLPEPKTHGDDHVGVKAANLYLGFDRVAEPAGKGAVSVWFKVPDAAASFARLVGLGAREKSAPDSACSPGETLATLFDPEGNVVGLIGPPPGGDRG